MTASRGETRSIASRGLLWLLAGGSLAALILGGALGQGAGGDGASPPVVYSRQGISAGRLMTPRAISVALASENQPRDEIFLVDKTARIQVFSGDGDFLRSWRMPAWKNGKPTGLGLSRDGRRLLVADTHYYRVLAYSLEGKLLADQPLDKGLGSEPGKFGMVTDVAQDSRGNYYVGEYGGRDRIQKFSPAGEPLAAWGGLGQQPGQFRRPQSLVIDRRDLLWVVDGNNHRIQVLDVSGPEPVSEPLLVWGGPGSESGRFKHPYDLVLVEEKAVNGAARGYAYVCEIGNHRVQKFEFRIEQSGAGARLSVVPEPVAVWGGNGRRPGQLHQPWALGRDSQGRIHIVDTYNNRVQRVQF